MKDKKYEKILKELPFILEGETNLISNLANTAALLSREFSFLWVGFYLVDQSENNLVLGPFQGPLACTRVAYGKGVCGAAWRDSKTFIVDDVHSFDGHIACSSDSNSEVVVPIIKNSEVVAVIDIDSEKYSYFSDIDAKNLEKIAILLSVIF